MSVILKKIIKEIKNGQTIDFTKTDFTYEEYLSELKLNILLEKIDGDKTYLDYLLEGVKSCRLNTDLNEISLRWCSAEDTAKFYITLAKHDMIPYIEKITPSALSYKSWGSATVLELLLDSDLELTFDKILNDEIKSDIEVAAILMNRGFSVEKYNVSKEEKVINNYELENNKKLGIGPLSQESEHLLEELHDLFKKDNISDEYLVEAFIISYRQSLISNYNVTLLELRKLVEIKEKNMNKFVLLSANKGAYFDDMTKNIRSSKLISNVLLHEAGHALHNFLANDSIPENFHEVTKNIQKNPLILEKVEEFANDYNNIQKEVDIIIKEECNEYFDQYFTEDKIKEIESYLEKESSIRKADLIYLEIDNEIIDKVLKEAFTVNEYIEHKKRIYIEEYTISYMRIKYGNLVAISDILDAIYEGKLSDGRLVNKNGITIPKAYGHGISYYSDINYCFSEIIADYASILKDFDGKKHLDLLHSIIGDELYNLIADYYNDNILKGEIISKDVSLK